MQSFLKWLGTLVFGETNKPVAPNSHFMNDHLRATQIQRRAKKFTNQTIGDNVAGKPQDSTVVGGCAGRIETAGPGKNVLVGYDLTEATANVQESLTLEDFDTGATGEAVAFDPYNTGRFDSSANWSKIVRK